jgi:hypothetical protein
MAHFPPQLNSIPYGQATPTDTPVQQTSAQLDGLDDEQSRRKIICMHHTRAPLNRPDKHMPRTGPKVDTI